MPDHLVVFDDVEVIQRGDMGLRCRVAGQPGSDVHIGGRRLVLRRSDAAELGLIDWKPAAAS
jgi:hypothetical protein